MNKKIRVRNVDLIRWINYGQKNTAIKLYRVTNANYVSKMATGDMEISDRMARAIESELALPEGWIDRDNVEFLKTSKTDFQLTQMIVGLSPEVKTALSTLINSIQMGLPTKEIGNAAS